MRLPLRITFKRLAPSKSGAVHERAARLEKHLESITDCHVVIETPHLRHHKGMLFEVRILVAVPGQELVVSRHAGRDHAHEDVHVALRDAFAAMHRQLAGVVARRRPS